jgi:hypothetical protein
MIVDGFNEASQILTLTGRAVACPLLARSLSPCPQFDLEVSDEPTDAFLPLPFLRSLCQKNPENSIVLLDVPERIPAWSNYLHDP